MTKKSDERETGPEAVVFEEHDLGEAPEGFDPTQPFGPSEEPDEESDDPFLTTEGQIEQHLVSGAVQARVGFRLGGLVAWYSPEKAVEVALDVLRKCHQLEAMLAVRRVILETGGSDAVAQGVINRAVAHLQAGVGE